MANSAEDVKKKKFAFRRFLNGISDRLGDANIRAMKNLLYDTIPAKQREEIDSGNGIFNILLEQNMLSYTDMQFLCDVLDSVGRKDLMEEVKEYIEKQDVPQAETGYVYELNTLTLKAIATEVGRDWKMLARHLNVDEGVVQSIHQANFGDLHEASLQALLRWKKDGGEKATPKALKRALTEMKLMSIVHRHFDAVM